MVRLSSGFFPLPFFSSPFLLTDCPLLYQVPARHVLARALGHQGWRRERASWVVDQQRQLNGPSFLAASQ